MTEKLDLKQLERNIFRDYFEDGLVDVLFGAYFFVVGLLLPVGSVAPVIALFVIFYLPLLRWLKKRFTYPRTGYVELRQGDPGPLPWLVIGSLVLIAAGVIAQPAQWYRWMPIFFGIWMAGILLGLGLSAGLVRHMVGAGLALVSGPLFALLPLTGKLTNIGCFLAAVGGVMLAWGVLVFVRFLLRHPPPAGEGADVSD